MNKIVFTGPPKQTNKWGGWGWRRCRILRHWGVQLILAYSLARPVILVAGKGRGKRFSLLVFSPFPLSSLTLSFVSAIIVSFFFFSFFSGR